MYKFDQFVKYNSRCDCVLSVKARPLTETRDMGQRRRAERARRRWSYGGESQSLTHTPRVMAGTCAH